MTAMLGAKARFLLHSGAAGSAPRLHRGKNALKKEMDVRLTVTLTGCEVLSGNPVSIDQIDGYSRKAAVFTVRVPEEADLTVTVSGRRCGKASRTVHIRP